MSEEVQAMREGQETDLNEKEVNEMEVNHEENESDLEIHSEEAEGEIIDEAAEKLMEAEKKLNECVDK